MPSGVVSGDHVEGVRTAQLPGHFAPSRANLAAAFLKAHVLRAAPRADQDRAVDVLRYRCAVLRKQLIETGQIPRRRSACHVIERQHGVGFAAPEVGLKFDHRIAARAGESLGRAYQKRAEAVGEVGAVEELPRVAVFRRRASGVDLAEIGCELRLQEIAGRDVMVRFRRPRARAIGLRLCRRKSPPAAGSCGAPRCVAAEAANSACRKSPVATSWCGFDDLAPGQ